MASCQWRNSVKVPSLIHQLYRHYLCMMDLCSTMPCYTCRHQHYRQAPHTSYENPLHPLCHLDNRHNGGSDHFWTLHNTLVLNNTLFAVNCVRVCAWSPKTLNLQITKWNLQILFSMHEININIKIECITITNCCSSHEGPNWKVVWWYSWGTKKLRYTD